ncbi:DNA-binding transcriptional regulator, FadR family [Thermomonospora echinospora]|uniref:DNA-binding transcriptional regulator, FadR family n=1 Tax=Thermomonospora echinospora TaxID=1992 RepID=A0A1H6ANH0_9ACTN|nr:FCD domain-containing protein [Thermomonospora echinospora]SEG49595.1 DNA-binding transcriptional regulator, FadR family [Thermomonospora echinospora]
MPDATPSPSSAHPAAQLAQPAIADLVAESIRDRIISGELVEGDLLPRQEEMLRELNVSRPSYREALRILEAEGLISVRRGNRGGVVVHSPSQHTTTYTLGLLLRYRQVSLGDLSDAISEIEPLCAGVAAGLPDRHEKLIPELNTLVDTQERALGEAQEFTRIGREFHEALVGGCGNMTLISTAGALAQLWSKQELEWADVVAANAAYPAVEQQRQVLQTHRMIVAAVAAGDRQQATNLARAHSLASHHHVLEGRRDLTVIHPRSSRVPGRGTVG